MAAVKNLTEKPGVAAAILCLFGLPFLGIGVWTASTGLVPPLRDSRAARQWDEVPARIVRAELKTIDCGEGLSSRVIAEYQYQYQGRQYTGRRVGFHPGSDNIGSFQYDVYRELDSQRRADRPFRCYVNPARPVESVLYRDLRLEMVGFQLLFAILFAGGGCGLMIAAVCAFFAMRRDAALAAAHPEEPWLWNKSWSQGKIKSSVGSQLTRAVAAAVLWNTFSVPVGVFLVHEVVDNGNGMALLAMIFPALGLLILGAAIGILPRWLRYGGAEFRMASVPGVIGGTLAGVIRVSARIWAKGEVRIALNCVQEVDRSGQGSVDFSCEEVVWQDERVVEQGLMSEDPWQATIPVLFHIPHACDETERSNTTWRLELSVGEPGSTPLAVFEVPMFRCAASDPEFLPDANAVADHASLVDPRRDLREARAIKIDHPDAAGCRFVFRAGRFAPSTLFASALFLVCSALIVVGLCQKSPAQVLIPLGLFASLLLLYIVRVGLHGSEVDVSNRGLAISGGPLGLGRRHWIDADDIACFDVVQVSNAGYFHLVLVCGDARRLAIAKWLPGFRLANSVKRQIEEAMGKE